MFPVPKVTVRYTKLFVGGILKGMTYVDKLTFPRSDADRQLRSMQLDIEYEKVYNNFVNGSPYRIINIVDVEEG